MIWKGLNGAPQFHRPKLCDVCGGGVVVFHACVLRWREVGSWFLLHRFIVRRRRIILCKMRGKVWRQGLMLAPDSAPIRDRLFGKALRRTLRFISPGCPSFAKSWGTGKLSKSRLRGINRSPTQPRACRQSIRPLPPELAPDCEQEQAKQR